VAPPGPASCFPPHYSGLNSGHWSTPTVADVLGSAPQDNRPGAFVIVV